WRGVGMVRRERWCLEAAVANLVRGAVANDETMGEPVKARSQIWISPWVVHRHRKFWEQPTAFLPERFAGKASPWTANGAYLPFGAGPRICIGAAFAMAEAHIIMATLLVPYRILRPDLRPLVPVSPLPIPPTLTP